MSLRRTAKNLRLSYNTVSARFLWMAELARLQHEKFLRELSSVSEIQLDEMESIEHTKLKPVTIPLIVDDQQRILSVACGEIPAKGYLSEISRKKYGPRTSTSEHLVAKILEQLPNQLQVNVIKTDGKSSYLKSIHRRFPTVRHEICVRKEEKRREQLYLKYEKKMFDPMFALNQRCAKLRADINRLIRRSWSTTKKTENLEKHLLIYACYNNQVEIFA
jgi:hypothetical protein